MPASPLLPQETAPFFVLAASPRPGGNSDTAAGLFLQGYSRAEAAAREGQGESVAHDAGSGDGPKPVYLRSHRVEPCVSCNACSHAARHMTNPDLAEAGASGPGPSLHFGCPLTLKDDSTPLLRLLAKAEGLCIVAPIYFYHQPAALKALVDRTQPFWSLRDAGVTCYSAQKPRSCHVILLAARTKGDKLFEGSLLTLKYALSPLNIRLAEPLLLTGLDGPSDLLEQPEAMRSIVAYGEEAGSRS